jgi:hypothetical protein
MVHKPNARVLSERDEEMNKMTILMPGLEAVKQLITSMQ